MVESKGQRSPVGAANAGGEGMRWDAAPVVDGGWVSRAPLPDLERGFAATAGPSDLPAFGSLRGEQPQQQGLGSLDILMGGDSRSALDFDRDPVAPSAPPPVDARGSLDQEMGSPPTPPPPSKKARLVLPRPVGFDRPRACVEHCRSPSAAKGITAGSSSAAAGGLTAAQAPLFLECAGSSAHYRPYSSGIPGLSQLGEGVGRVELPSIAVQLSRHQGSRWDGLEAPPAGYCAGDPTGIDGEGVSVSRPQGREFPRLLGFDEEANLRTRRMSDPFRGPDFKGKAAVGAEAGEYTLSKAPPFDASKRIYGEDLTEMLRAAELKDATRLSPTPDADSQRKQLEKRERRKALAARNEKFWRRAVRREGGEGGDEEKDGEAARGLSEAYVWKPGQSRREECAEQ